MFHQKLMKRIYCKKAKGTLRHIVMMLALSLSLNVSAHSVMDDGHHVDVYRKTELGQAAEYRGVNGFARCLY